MRTFGSSFLLLLVGTAAHASEAIAVKARPLRVDISDTSAGYTVLLRGVLSFGKNAGQGYTAPACGFGYWTCPAGERAMCALAFADLEKAARMGTCVGFGQRFSPAGTFRAADAPVSNPDAWPIGMGVVTFSSCATAALPGGGSEPVDLTIACAVASAGSDGGLDAAAQTPDASPDAPRANGGSGGSGVGGSGGAVAGTGGTGGTAGTEGTAGAGTGGTGAPAPKSDDGCAMGTRPSARALPLVILALGLGLIRRRRG